MCVCHMFNKVLTYLLTYLLGLNHIRHDLSPFVRLSLRLSVDKS